MLDEGEEGRGWGEERIFFLAFHLPTNQPTDGLTGVGARYAYGATPFPRKTWIYKDATIGTQIKERNDRKAVHRKTNDTMNKYRKTIYDMYKYRNANIGTHM